MFTKVLNIFCGFDKSLSFLSLLWHLWYIPCSRHRSIMSSWEICSLIFHLKTQVVREAIISDFAAYHGRGKEGSVAPHTGIKVVQPRSDLLDFWAPSSKQGLLSPWKFPSCSTHCQGLSFTGSKPKMAVDHRVCLASYVCAHLGFFSSRA